MYVKPAPTDSAMEMTTMNNTISKRQLSTVRRPMAMVLAMIYGGSLYAGSTAYAGDLRYESITESSAPAAESSLLPRTPRTNPSGQLSFGVYNGLSEDGKLDYSANADVGKITVEEIGRAHV